MNEPIDTAAQINDIAARVLIPGTEMSRVYQGLFDALKAIAEVLDRIEGNVTPDKDEP